MSTSHLQFIMTAQEYIRTKLEELKQPVSLEKPENHNELVEAIFKILMSKKFRKYAAKPELVDHMKNAIGVCIEKNQPINLTFTQGAYKLWRLEESPEADWAELFAAMHYTAWVKPICKIYEPGVWFDFFMDDLILPVLNDVTIEESNVYKQTFGSILDILKEFQPGNLKMTITGVGEQFESKEAFYKKLDEDTAKYADNFPTGLPELDEAGAAMIQLNAKDSVDKKDPNWMAKNKLIHDAYLTHTKAETGYHNRPDKIKVFSQPLASNMFLAPGTTKDSVAKHWAGAGVLKPKDDDFRRLILTPSQLDKTKFEWEDVHLDGLNGKNFEKIRVVTA